MEFGICNLEWCRTQSGFLVLTLEVWILHPLQWLWLIHLGQPHGRQNQTLLQLTFLGCNKKTHMWAYSINILGPIVCPFASASHGEDVCFVNHGNKNDGVGPMVSSGCEILFLRLVRSCFLIPLFLKNTFESFFSMSKVQQPAAPFHTPSSKSCLSFCALAANRWV